MNFIENDILINYKLFLLDNMDIDSGQRKKILNTPIHGYCIKYTIRKIIDIAFSITLLFVSNDETIKDTKICKYFYVPFTNLMFDIEMCVLRVLRWCNW